MAKIDRLPRECPIERLYAEVLDRASAGKSGDDLFRSQHAVRVLFQDIRDYLGRGGRDPALVEEGEVLTLALQGLYSAQKKEVLDGFTTVLREVELEAGLPQILSQIVHERMRRRG